MSKRKLVNKLDNDLDSELCNKKPLDIKNRYNTRNAKNKRKFEVSDDLSNASKQVQCSQNNSKSFDNFKYDDSECNDPEYNSNHEHSYDDSYDDSYDSFIDHDDINYKKEINREKYFEKHRKNNFDRINYRTNKRNRNDTNDISDKYLLESVRLRNLIKQTEITYNTIFESKLSDKDKMWFIIHLDILNNTQRHTEDRERIYRTIYSKYNELTENIKNSNFLDNINPLIKNDSILKDIFNSSHSNEIKGMLYKKYKSLEDQEKTEEYYKIINWIKSILDIPSTIKLLEGQDKKLSNQNIEKLILKLNNTLNNKLYGLKYVKERILEYFCGILQNPEYKKKFIAFVGPPGVGKTMLAQTIAEAMDLPYEHISLGGIKDSSVLIGHSSTYIGSTPGLFVNILQKTKVLNPVILLDELDKINYSSDGMSISSILLHVLDHSQNMKFKDMYVSDINIDLSKVFFIIAMNNADNIDPILKDRIHIININNYTLDEKINIGINYIVPKILNNLNMTNEIIFNNENIKYIIQKNSDIFNENGVRKLEKSISTICEKINVLKIFNSLSKNIHNDIKLSYNISNLKFPCKLTNTIIDNLLVNQ
jgi:ATP-dependent Lon protease